MRLNKASLAIAGLSILTVVHSQGATIAAFQFPATNSVVATTSGDNLTIGDFSLSSGGVQTNITTGNYFPNEPYVQGSGSWNSATQTGAKNFFFTITASPGVTFTIENVSFNAYATGTGPTAFGLAVGTTNITSVDAPDQSLVAFNSPVTGQSNLSSATIRFQGWDNGSRVTNGNGDFRIDDILVTGTIIPEPSTTLLGALGALALLRRRR